MSQIFGHLNISDSDYVMNNTVGQGVIWEAVQEYLGNYNRQVELAMSTFIAKTTELYKLRYKMPGGGYLQRRGSDGSYAATKAYGQWDVAFPLEDFGAQIAGNDVDMAYMTVQELDRHVRSVALQDTNTLRYELLKRLFKNTATTFADPLYGNLTIEAAANGDSVVYPPVMGSETEATDDHYLESGYASASISDTNNPLVTIHDELAEHYQIGPGEQIVTFINKAERAKVEALTDFDDVQNPHVRPGTDTSVPIGMPTGVPGIVIGFSNGVWVVNWDWIPSGYMLGVSLDAEPPLQLRVDPAATGLGSGLQLVAEEEEFPFKHSFWRRRFGVGYGNRLNTAVMELGTGGTYTIPTAYQ